MSLLNNARRELLRLRMSMQEAAQPLPSRGQVEQVVREMGQQGTAKRQGTWYKEDEEKKYQEDQERQRRSQQGQGVFPQQQGIIGGLLGGLGGGAGGRFPIRDALATYIKSRAGPQPPQEGEEPEYYEKRRSRKISLAD